MSWPPAVLSFRSILGERHPGSRFYPGSGAVGRPSRRKRSRTRTILRRKGITGVAASKLSLCSRGQSPGPAQRAAATFLRYDIASEEDSARPSGRLRHARRQRRRGGPTWSRSPNTDKTRTHGGPARGPGQLSCWKGWCARRDSNARPLAPEGRTGRIRRRLTKAHSREINELTRSVCRGLSSAFVKTRREHGESRWNGPSVGSAGKCRVVSTTARVDCGSRAGSSRVVEPQDCRCDFDASALIPRISRYDAKLPCPAAVSR